LLGAAGVPIVALALGYPRASILAAAIVSVIIIVRHHENIARLLRGTERRFGEKVKAA
jgi:glycerol-3-phosphate acyltransferase PlsY